MSKGALRPKEAGQVLLHGADAGDAKGDHPQLGGHGGHPFGDVDSRSCRAATSGCFPQPPTRVQPGVS